MKSGIVLWAAAAVLVVLAIGVFVVVAGAPTTAPSATPTPTPSGSAVPTADPDDAAGIPEDPGASPAPAPPAEEPGTGTVGVVIVYAAWDAASDSLDVSTFVEDVVEDGGTCVLTARGANGTITREGAAMADATTTACPRLSVPGEELVAGSYEVVVSYRSEGYTGQSAPVGVEVTR